MNKLSQINLYEGEGYKGFGPLGLEDRGADLGVVTFANFISSAIGLITLIAIIWFIFTLITGAVGIITSGGDKQALESAKKKITSGLIGLIVTIFALFVVGMIGWMLGLSNILSVQEMFTKLIIK